VRLSFFRIETPAELQTIPHKESAVTVITILPGGTPYLRGMESKNYMSSDTLDL
jgi:hypothetical protein